MKQYNISILLMLIVYVLSPAVHAGDIGGNSGHFVECKNNGEVQGDFLLDYLEGIIQPQPLIPELGSDSLDVVSKALVAIDRLAVYDPARASRYSQKVKEFFSPSITGWVETGPELPFIADMGVINIPSNCQLSQLLNYHPVHPSWPRYVVDKRFYNRLTPTHQAGLLLHEAIYAETLSLGQDNSMNARKFNALISSRRFEGLSPFEYEEMAKKIFEPQYGPEFKAGILTKNVKMGLGFEIGLRSLLKQVGTGTLSFQFLKPLPEWLEYRADSYQLLGTVPVMEPQDVDVHLVAFDGKKSAIAILRIQVKN